MTIEQKKKGIRRGKIFLLFDALYLALTENRIEPLKTDIYKVASEYYVSLKKSDFDLIKNMTINEIVEELK